MIHMCTVCLFFSNCPREKRYVKLGYHPGWTRNAAIAKVMAYFKAKSAEPHFTGGA